jgi:hypothetical protein
MEHTEAGVDNSVVPLEVPVAAWLVVLDIAGVQPLLAVPVGDSRIPAAWSAQMELVGLIASGDVVHELGIVVEVGCEALVAVAHWEQEGQAVPVVGKEEGLAVVVEQLARAQLAAVVGLSAQHWHFLVEHLLL